MKAQPVVPFDHSWRQHPDFDKLILNPNYFQDRMMASVSRPSTVAGEVAMLRGVSEQAEEETRQLREEVQQLRRLVQEGGS